MRLIRPTTITPAMLTACNVPEDDAPAWAIGTAYVVGNQVIDDHKLYEALQDNSGSKPADNVGGTAPKWLDMGAVNRWKMFDDKVGSQTANADQIIFTVVPGSVVDSIAFLDMEAATIDIVMTDPVDGVVYSETVDLVAKSAVVDGYSYFFDPIITTDAAVILGIPPYSSASIAISINYDNGTAKAGTVALGMQKFLGETQYDATFGIVDYSKKQEDDFGNFYVLERAYSKEISCEVYCQGANFDDLNRTLSAYRATPLIWVGSDVGYSSFIVYGFVRSFSNAAIGPDSAMCTLKILGLS